ncbi:MAG: acyl carrier protein [Myxococcales bacterium]|nr:acyl carrier protein [Myxococcales bacterium]
MTREEIQQRIVDILVKTFEIDASEIRPESNLFEDFDLDSIDAIDMFVELTEVTGRRVDPEVARTLRTVEDIVNLIEGELAAGQGDATQAAQGEADSPAQGESAD